MGRGLPAAADRAAVMTAIAARRRCAVPACAIAIALTMCQAPAATAQSAAASFFAGKQINFICGAAVGGGYDALARLVARHLGAHIAGNPSVVVQNMPAAGSLAATNLIANTAPKDGLTIALVQRGMLLARLSNPGAVRFDLDKLNWIGSLSSEVGLAFAWYTSAHKTAEDLFEKELIVGGHTGVDPELTPRLYNAVLGTKFKIVTGYNGTADIGLAIERGEVEGIGDWSWSSLKKQKPDWIRDRKITPLLQSALQNDPELPNVRNALEFAKTDSTAGSSSSTSPKRRWRGRSSPRPAFPRSGSRCCAPRWRRSPMISRSWPMPRGRAWKPIRSPAPPSTRSWP